jgi:putative solute:sodium symporter small subunit
MGDNLRRYWRKTQRLTAALLAVWVVVSFGAVYFARELSFDFFGWPFGWWMAAQGALLVYLLIVGVYARAMRRLDDEHGVSEDP